MARERTNDEWLAALRAAGPADEAAARDLERYLRRIVGRLAGARLDEADLSDVVQESLARIVAGLGGFRGDAAFTTWAAAVATRVTFTELRRRRARAAELSFDTVLEELREPSDARAPEPEDSAAHGQLLEALREAIGSRLTERQRAAVVSELRGVPTADIAAALGTNPNALYKLVHDARRKLRQALIEAGFDETSLHVGAKEASRWP